jgi:hypothetical protein
MFPTTSFAWRCRRVCRGRGWTGSRRTGHGFASSGRHQAPRRTGDQQNNGHHGPQREDVSLHQVDLASDVPGVDQ